MWLREKVLPFTGDYEKREPNSIIVLDNARIHKMARQIIESESNARCIYLPPYSPDLNPIELMFHSYKQGLKRHKNKGHHQAHRIALRTVTPDIAGAYFKHSKVPKCDHYQSKGEIEKQQKERDIIMHSIMMTNTQLSSVAAWHTVNSRR